MNDSKNSQQEQLNLDLDFTMQGGTPTISVSSISDSITFGDDTITLGSGTFDYQINQNTLWPAATITSATGIGTGAVGAGYTFTSPNTIGSYGQILSTGTNGLSWNDYSNVTPGALQVRGDAEFEGDVKIKGKSINEMFEKIEERLAILHPNEKLEEKWEELRELRNRYVELEKEIIEKEKMWDILKK
jgi:hypothetical protein